MKKILFALVILSGIFLSGCKSNNSSDPKAVLSDFFDALSKKDIEKARTLATEDSKSMLDMMDMGMKMSKDTGTDTKFDRSKLEIGEAKIDGDKAVISVKETTSGETMNYTMKKEKGAWKVAFDKSSLMGPNMDKINEATDSLKMNMNDIPADSLKDAIDDGLKMMDTLRKMNP